MNNYTRQCELDSYRNIIHKLQTFAIAVPLCSGVGAPCLQVPPMRRQVRHMGSTQKEVQKYVYRQCAHWIHNASVLCNTYRYYYYYYYYYDTITTSGAWGSVVVKALRYKSEGPRIDSRCRRGFFRGIRQFRVPWGRLSL